MSKNFWVIIALTLAISTGYLYWVGQKWYHLCTKAVVFISLEDDYFDCIEKNYLNHVNTSLVGNKEEGPCYESRLAAEDARAEYDVAMAHFLGKRV